MATTVDNSQEQIGKYAQRFERQLGDTEASYFLPSRADGVNDMYLHLGFRAPPYRVQREVVNTVWAIMRIRHPLLASSVELHSYEDIRFVYMIPPSSQEALQDASNSLDYRTGTKEELIDSYLNGPRTLSSTKLSYLVISSPGSVDGQTMQEYDMLICTTHYLGDGIALHTFAHDFFHLLGDRSQGDLVDILQSEWTTRCSDPDVENVIPAPLEDRLPNLPHNSIQRVAARIDFQLTQERLIGGHSFPKRGGQPRHTIVPTISIDESRTQKILKKCKEKGVSISSALFAICNIAWGRTSRQNWELPMMMYSALNLRPNLVFHKSHHDSYWFIAIGYFNVVLPTFLPKDSDRGNVESMFWLRAHSAKKQSTVAAKSKLLSGRCREMARERAERARIWAKEDDEKAAGTRKAPDSVPAKPKAPARPPSNALIGLSLLGNLDAIYKHASFPEIQLHTLTTGSRQRPGGMLLFSYTFVGKLWVSLGYDENGFEKGVVDTYWHNILSGIEEFLG